MTIPQELHLDVSTWLNGQPPSADVLRGKVVLVETFQMLCPGCIAYGLPQAQRVHRLFPRDQVVVLGLHTVFEHHDVMGPDALAVFLAEYRIPFPVGVDRATDGPMPATMARYRLHGTPSTLIVDKAGLLRHSLFGEIDDLALGTLLGQLLTEDTAPAAVATSASAPGVCLPGVGCD